MANTKKSSKSNSIITVEIAGEKHKGAGETAYDALMDLPLNYTHIKTKGTVTLTVGGKKSERFLYMFPLRRAFANKTRLSGLAKQLESLLK